MDSVGPKFGSLYRIRKDHVQNSYDCPVYESVDDMPLLFYNITIDGDPNSAHKEFTESLNCLSGAQYALQQQLLELLIIAYHLLQLQLQFL